MSDETESESAASLADLIDGRVAVAEVMEKPTVSMFAVEMRRIAAILRARQPVPGGEAACEPDWSLIAQKLLSYSHLSIKACSPVRSDWMKPTPGYLEARLREFHAAARAAARSAEAR